MSTPAARALRALEELSATMQKMSEQEAMRYYKEDIENIDALTDRAFGLHSLLYRARHLLWAAHMAEVREWADRGWPQDYKFRMLGRVTVGDKT